MLEIDEEKYIAALEKLVQSSAKRYATPNVFQLKNKIAQYIIGRGYESELVWKYIQQHFDH